jgi:hypothetical protein
MDKLIENKDYMLYYPATMSSYGLLLGNRDKIPKDWVPAGDKVVSMYSNEMKTIYCPPELVERVRDEIIKPSWKESRDYQMPYT